MASLSSSTAAPSGANTKRARVDALPGEPTAPDEHPFGFPFPPYACQLDFMRSLYQCLDDGGIGVFESPTGTGKSLSLVCGALRWLQDQQRREERLLEEKLAASEADAEDWVDNWYTDMKLSRLQRRSSALAEKREVRTKRLQQYEALRSSRRRAEQQHARAGTSWQGDVGGGGGGGRHLGGASAIAKAAAATTTTSGASMDEFLLGEWHSAASDARRRAVLEISDAELGGPSDGEDADGGVDGEGGTPRTPWRIYYCSRTHSQLAQVVGEVRKTAFAKQLGVVSLGSRKALCTNEAVRGAPGGAERVNELCLDLQSKAAKAKRAAGKGNEGAAADRTTREGDRGLGGDGGGAGCSLHRPRDAANKEARQAVTDSALLAPRDVEELGALGRREGCCAYYAARDALPDAQLVLLPYASLLHAGTRESLGLSLRRSVVIVDEAHNLIDTINDTHSVTLTARQLSEVSAQLAQYAEKYHARLKPTNRLCVQQLLQVVRALRAALQPPAAGAPRVGGGGGSGEVTERIVRLNEFLSALRVDHLNLFDLTAFCEGSQIARKLRGFADAEVQTSRQQQQQQQQQAGRGGGGVGGVAAAASGSLHGVVRLLEALTNDDKDGRVLLHIEPPLQPTAGTSSASASATAGAAASSAAVRSAAGAASAGTPTGSWLKVLHLNPSVYFSRVLSEAHAVVLAGGTMQPFADLEQQLFHSERAGRLRMVSYGHIVPSANLLPIVVPVGPTGVQFQFTFGARAATPQLDELGRLLLSLAASVPDGIVVFLPSFGYEEQVVSHWQASGVWAQLGRLKRLYREPREASELDAVLKSYAAAIEATFGPDDDDDDDDGQQRQRQQLLQAGGTGTGSAGDAGASGGGTSGGGGRTRPKGGALLLSIVGGKMSEGINFSDGLGRCVVMVGLPFANPSELTLQERWAHLDATHGVGAGREYYTNLCLKAVNQSIGRAIRHIGDYATIVLADSRFGKASIRQRLPQWIGSQLRTALSHQQALSAIESFFGGRAAEQRSIEARRRARARGEEL